VWTGNCPNCGEPHGGTCLHPGLRVLCLKCLTPFTIPPRQSSVIARIHPAKRGDELLWDRDDDRDQT
jgi:hypothetical protein